MYLSFSIPVSLYPINKGKKKHINYTKTLRALTCNAVNCQFVSGPHWLVVLCPVRHAGTLAWFHALRALSFLHIITDSLMVMWPCRVRVFGPKTPRIPRQHPQLDRNPFSQSVSWGEMIIFLSGKAKKRTTTLHPPPSSLELKLCWQPLTHTAYTVKSIYMLRFARRF